MNTKFLIAVAMSLSLCSCSSDEEIVKPAECAHLNVVLEQLEYESETRAAYVPTGNILYWQNGDAINVYDDKLTTYDQYAFNPAKSLFTTNQTSSAIEGSITYALFPMDLVDYAGWTSHGNRAVINLPTTIVYNSDIENTAIVSGQTLYVAKLPMWGTATGDFGNVTVNLKYLCAVMKLKVSKDKASFVKIASATKPLSGGVEAVIAKNGQTEVEPVIKKGAASLGTRNYVILDLRQMTSDEGYVYVPIIPDTYEDMTVSYTNLEVPVGTDLTKAQIADKDETIWTLLKAYPKTGKAFVRNKVYVVNL
jgi:hypothetical protein